MRAVSAGAIVVLIVTGVFLANPKPVENLNNKTWDLLTGWTGHHKPSGHVAIVEIDEKSLQQYGRWPWPRELMGLLMRRILDRGAASVVFDIMFPQHDDSLAEELLTGRATEHLDKNERDAGEVAFAVALSGNPTIVGYTFIFGQSGVNSNPCDVRPLPLVIVSSNGSEEKAFSKASGALCSDPRISRAAAGNGFLNAAPDGDGKMRRIPLIIENSGRHYPSLALASLAYLRRPTIQLETNARGASLLRMNGRAIPLEGPSLMRLRFRGARRTFPYISAADILAGAVPAGALGGKIVIIGSSALGLQNPIPTPTDTQFPGVEIQATAIDNLLQGDPFSRPAHAPLLELALALAAGMLSAFLLGFVRYLWGTIISIAIAASAWVACIFALAAAGILYSPLPVTAALACNFLIITPLNYLQEKKRADRTNKQLDSAKELAREVLEKSESRYQMLVENINDAIIMDDVEGRMVFANRRFLEWFELDKNNLHNAVLEDFVAPESQPIVRNWHNCRMRGEPAPDHYEFKGIRPNGTYIWLEAQVTIVKEAGRIIGTQAALRDITNRKQIEAQFLQAQKMESVGRLAGSVAHDFNNILTVIIGYSDLLLSEMRPDDPCRADAEQILLAGEHGSELAKKLLAISRKQLAQPVELDLNHVLAEEEKMLGRLVGEDIELIMRLCPEAAYVMADPGQLHQVLMNLVVNAKDSMPSGGKLIIETKNVIVDEDFASRNPNLKPGPYVYLGVIDTGAGMSDEVKSHLFEPFFTTKEVNRGTGLGLATVHSIIQQSGGWIEATSEVNQGAAFHIYLPRIKADLTVRPLHTNNSKLARRGMETVLVVEDQDAVRQLIGAILKGYGYHVLQVSNGPDAITVAGQHQGPIHLLLTDLVMPSMNGRVLAETLTKARPAIKVLYISGYAEETIGNSGILDRNTVFLPKPFTPEALAAKVRKALENQPPCASS